MLIQLIFFLIMSSVYTTAFSGVKYIFTQMGNVQPLELTSFVTILIVLCLYTMVFGRFFCGFACAFGTLGDYLHELYLWLCRKTKRRPIKINDSVKQKLSTVKYFILAAIFTTVCVNLGVDSSVFAPLKELSKFLIIMAMAAIGLNSNVIQLIKTGGKPIAVGATCWCGITIVSLVMQHVMNIW